MARARSEKSLARFDRIALVLSGGGALGAYQAGAYAALESAGIRPNWIAGSAIGAVNAAIIAGNLPHERSFRLRQFWRELSRRAMDVAARQCVLVAIKLAEDDRPAVAHQRQEGLPDIHEGKHRVRDVLIFALVAKPLRRGIRVVRRKERHDVD